ncbi:hypothetical protein HHK36_026895 [Tetracentron sinense]|uniref:Lactate/malate dehydrogenase C-terminal domain-containing protein n=1 Tax=Tetracentron sinense TaxID=13715 RepID=A0A834YFV9_TETSI|nr:hypothetical protein HHK36_026895 [Tetracentron sinense]
MAKEPVRVLLTGAAGQIDYALVPMIARGVMLGPDQPVILHMLDIVPAAEALNGVKWSVVATTDVVAACTGVNIAVMVLVVANPSNTNALILKEFAPSIPEKKHNLSDKYPDVNHATMKTPAGEKPAQELVSDDKWLNGEFITTVKQLGAAIIKARKLSSAVSAASTACDHIRDWVLGTPEGTWVSIAVYSDGSFNVLAGLIYSFPVTCRNGEWTMNKVRE